MLALQYALFTLLAVPARSVLLTIAGAAVPVTVVQLAPSGPFARLKLSVALPAEFVVQVTATLVMFADPIVPDPLATEQLCPVGLVFTVTLYAEPVARAVAKVNAPLALTLRSSPPLSCSTTVPDRPETIPPTE